MNKWLFLSSVSHSNKSSNPRMESDIQLVRSTGNNLSQQLASEVEVGLVRLSPWTVESGFISKHTEFNSMLRHPAGAQELLTGIGKLPCTYLGIGSKKPLLISHFNLLFPTNYEYFFHVIIIWTSSLLRCLFKYFTHLNWVTSHYSYSYISYIS